MDATELFLQEHARVHSASVAQPEGVSLEDVLLGGLTEEQVRQRPHESMNSLSWLLWHMARCEDAAINTVVAGRAQVIEGAGWPERLGVARADIGTGMTDDEVSDFSARVDIPALRAYRAAVGQRTREVVSALRPDEWELPIGDAGLEAGGIGRSDRRERGLGAFVLGGQDEGLVHLLAGGWPQLLAPGRSDDGAQPGRAAAADLTEGRALARRKGKPMPLFLDIHRNITGVTPNDILQAHLADVAAQDPYNVKYLRWWFNNELGSIYCLVDAPNAEAAKDVHAAAHGLLADEIIPVEGGVFDDLIGPDEHGSAVREDPPDRISDDTAFRTIVFTDLEGSTALTQRIGDEASLKLLLTHDELMQGCLEQHGGHRVKHTGDGLMASFTSVAHAIECMISMQSALAEHNQASRDLPLRARMGAAAGEPVSHLQDLFGATVQLAARLCAHAQPGQIMVAGVVRDLCIGKIFAFQEQGEVQLKGFGVAVRVFEVRWKE